MTKLGVLAFDDSHGVPSQDYLEFCVTSLLIWCCLFAFVYWRTAPMARRRLWRVSPMVLFAFAFPADFVLFVSLLGLGGAGGEMP